MQALYREFRPHRFADVSAQPQVTDVLRAQVREGRPAHAYLFAGPRGTGKTSTARILAAALNCTDPKDGEPCLQCDSCRDMLADRDVDVIEIDAASNNSVDSIRELREKAGFLPARGRYRIYIIDEAHMLSKSAFNALLKTLEEPPPHIVFILATTELRKLPATVISRCIRFDFRRLTDESIVERLGQVMDALGRRAEPEALALIARAAAGGMRDALSILDKCVSGGGDVTAEGVREALGLEGEAEVEGIVSAIGAYDLSAAVSGVERGLGLGAEPGALASAILGALERRLEDSLGQPELARTFVSAIEILSDAEYRMKYAMKPAILLKAAVARCVLPESRPAAVPERMTKLEALAEGLDRRVSDLERRSNELPFGGLEGIFADSGIELVD